MEEVVNKLSEIEAAAVAIIESANEKKKELSEAMDKKTKQFDEEVNAGTEKTLSELSQKLKLETEQEISLLKENTAKALIDLEQGYQESHTALAKNILKNLIGV